MLYQLANQPGGFRPAKMFSIDRVFRNETMDATHLAEFHQVEGVVADRGLTLGDLIGKSLATPFKEGAELFQASCKLSSTKWESRISASNPLIILTQRYVPFHWFAL